MPPRPRKPLQQQPFYYSTGARDWWDMVQNWYRGENVETRKQIRAVKEAQSPLRYSQQAVMTPTERRAAAGGGVRYAAPAKPVSRSNIDIAALGLAGKPQFATTPLRSVKEAQSPLRYSQDWWDMVEAGKPGLVTGQDDIVPGGGYQEGARANASVRYLTDVGSGPVRWVDQPLAPMPPKTPSVKYDENRYYGKYGGYRFRLGEEEHNELAAKGWSQQEMDWLQRFGFEPSTRAEKGSAPAEFSQYTTSGRKLGYESPENFYEKTGRLHYTQFPYWRYGGQGGSGGHAGVRGKHSAGSVGGGGGQGSAYGWDEKKRGGGGSSRANNPAKPQWFEEMAGWRGI